MSRKYKKIIDDEYKQSRDYFRKAIEEQYQKDINKKTGTHSTLDDIAPVKKSTGKGWFNTGLFDDGFQASDIPKIILGTNKDLSEDLSGGLAGIAEGAVDAGAWAIGGIGKAFGNENLADKMQKFQERDLVKEYELDKRISDSLPGGQAMKLANFILNRGDTEKASVLGEKSDSLAQSAGQLAGTVALQAVGVPWWVTTGVTSFGAGTEQAFKGGATYGEAGAYGAISAGAEVLTEKLSGGIKFGGKTLDEGLKKTLTNAITNKTVKTLTKLGFDAVGEGGEEVLTEIIQNIGQKLTYEDEKTWSELLTSEEAMEGYLDAFIGGAVMGGGFNAGRTYKSIKTGRDYDTGLSDNEQRVIDSEVKNRTAEKQKQAAVKEKVSQIIAERERTIGTLTDAEKKSIQQSVQTQLDEGKLDFSKTEIDKKELAAIVKQVREDLDRGDIGIDAIESTLAGEKTAQINDLRAELSKTTNEAKKAEIQAKLNELTADRATQMQELLKKDVYLQESYRQEALKSQEFTREVTDKDSDITKELIESAKAVKMNDTRKMHDLFEYTNKIANDSGTKYGFVNNEQLKELGHEVEGSTVNGLVRVDKDGNAKVLINVDSAKALNTIIGHETTHLLEGTNEYKSLQNIVKQYATTKGDYDVRLQSMKKLYEGVDANLENELTADLVGDYLFTDEQFVKELTADRNVFQKIYDYVKRAYKMATAGSQEKRQLEKVKRSFEKAYKEISKTTTQQSKDNLATEADSNTKKTRQAFDLSEDTSLYRFIQDSLAGKLSKKAFHKIGKTISDRLANDIQKIVGFSVDGYGNEISPGNIEHINNEHGPEGRTDQNMSDLHELAKIGYVIDNYDKIREGKISRQYRNADGTLAKTVELQKKIDDDYYYVVEAVPDAKLKTLHVVSAYKNKNDTFIEEAASTDPSRYVQDELQSKASLSNNIVPDNDMEGNNKYSLSDNQGRELSKNQQEYFKESKVRDENGNLKVMYHGTTNAGFTVFNSEHSDDGRSFFFADKLEVAKGYSATNEMFKPVHFETPEELQDYISEELGEEVEIVKDGDRYVLYQDGEFVLRDKDLYSLYWSFNDEIVGYGGSDANYEVYLNLKNPLIVDADNNNWDEIPVEWTDDLLTTRAIAEYAQEAGYDGVMINNVIDTGIYGDRFETSNIAVAFDSNQIKSVHNEKPTGNQDIRYSLSVNDYGMSHRPSTDYGDGSNFEENMPDVFEHPEWYFRKSEAHNMESLRALRKVRGNPEGEITIYRATIGDTINEGDWISPSRKYAEMHNWHSLDGKGNILELKVKAKDIRFAGDDINEFGYFPNGVDEYSLSRFDEQLAEKRGTYNVYRSDVLMPEAQVPTVTEAPAEAPVEEIAPVVIPEELRYEEGRPLTEEDLPNFEQERSWSFDNITEEDLPAEAEEEFYSVPNTAAVDDKSLRMIAKNMKEELDLKPKQIKNLEKIIQDFSTSEDATRDALYEMIEEEFGTVYVQNKIDEVVQIKKDLREMRIKVSDTIKGDIPDYFQFKQRNFGKIRFSNQGLPVDDVYEGLKALYPGYFPADIYNPTDQLLRMVEVANLDSVYSEEYSLPEEQIQDVTDFISESVHEYKQEMAMKASHEVNLAPIDESLIPSEPKPKREIAPSNFDPNDFSVSRGVQQEYDAEAEEIVDSTHDIELERLEKRKKKALDDLGDLTSYTKQQAQALYDEVRMMQKGKKVSGDLGFILDRMFEGVDKKADNYEEVKDTTYKKITDALLAIERSPAKPEKTVPPTESLIRNSIETKYGWRVSEIEGMKLDSRAEARRKLRKELIGMNAEGLTKALDDAKNVPMMLMNNTDTIRNTELVFGRENGKIINEAIFQKEIDNEAKSIAWQNKERSEIKELGIKARSKESAAVQKYGEKQYVNEFGDLVKYGDDELAAEGFDAETQAKIRKAARIIREKYDTYIDLANETLTKLGFDPIKKRNDYMRHFQELNDVFSRYGIPFNAQAMQEHDLPTDINGLTDSWSPQKNYFANMQPRKGERTTLDAITGVDGYIGGIANLIHHTEDIQRGRAFEEIIRETYGEEKGWKNLEEMEGLSPEEYQARADKIQDNHLSNYAAWVHEWTNNIAGKKSKIDRSVESMFGRKAFALLDQVRKQVGSNMIGMNLSSSLTNLIAPVQAASKTKKLAVVKGTADTIKNIFVKDDFMEKNSFLIGRMGTDMLSKTPWQKVQDAGYIFMKGMDWFSSNQIVRSKYYELLSKGMTEEQAHAEAGKFAARIMGDRTKGAQAQLYNSKLIGLVTQFQLEVNNQLYSMFYDTYHESKETAKGNAARTAAGMTFTLGQLAALTHVFGKTFESVAGYNPTFDIIGIIATALGAGEDDDEKTTSERLKAAADKLVDALPYVNVLTGGGRIPIASGIPNLVGVATGGKDDYGNELTLEDELAKLRYLVLPTGGNQIKKTTQGLSMFDEDLPVSGSYTDSGNLRFSVEDTPLNRAQAAIFGQWASGNAQKYFDQERQPLKEKQIQEYKDLDIPIADYWEYRDGLKDLKTVEEKFDYVAGLDLPVAKKNIMINNIVDRDEKVDLINYDDFGSYEEFDWATKNPEKYDYLQSIGASYKDYAASEESKKAYNWAYENPEGYTVSRVVTGDVVKYRKIASDLYDIKADKDGNGKSISGSRKEKVAAYINSLDADYSSKIILFKSEYPSDDTYNYEIIDYLNNRQDISYADMVTILEKLEFTVDVEGNIYW